MKINKKPTMLMILDGFGLNPDSFGNAIKQANTPNIDRIFSTYPSTEFEDTAGRRCRHKPPIHQLKGENSAGASCDHGHDQDGVHQHVREINLMDSTQEVDDGRSWGGTLCVALSNQAVGVADRKSVV